MYPVERKRNDPWKVFLWVAFCLLCIVLMAYLILFRYNVFTLSVIPLGERDMVLSYGEAYTEAGALADFHGSRFLRDGFWDIPITQTGSVDTSRVGTYTLTYRAEFGLWRTDAVRTVTVVDTIAPSITLMGEQELYVLPNTQYQEAGFTAYDEYDGDITERVTCTRDGERIVYRVSDSSGNTAEVYRTVHENDPVPPEITLVGGENTELTIGCAYEELGYSAHDNCDGDLTEAVTVAGTVDPYHGGEYPIEYSVTDSFGNTTVVTRTVTVVPNALPDRVRPDGKIIYLTFDDGPGPYTERLLDVLARYGVKATFFVTGRGYADVIAKIAEQGHTVAIHTNSHIYREIYESEDAYFTDLFKISALIADQTGDVPRLLRFPGGSSNTVSCFNEGIMTRLTDAVTDMGYRYFDWNVDSNDAGGAKTSDEVYKNVINGISGKRMAVVLQHDIKDFSVDAVARIIEWGQENGYRFLALDLTSPSCEHHVNN